MDRDRGADTMITGMAPIMAAAPIMGTTTMAVTIMGTITTIIK